MIDIRKYMILSLLMMSAAAWAQDTGGLIITAGDTVKQIAISEVKELIFTDAGLTVVKTDDAVVEFPSSWQIRFGEVDESGITSVELSAPDAMAQVYNTKGVLLKEVRFDDLSISQLPSGVYIIKCNGKSLKIRR